MHDDKTPTPLPPPPVELKVTPLEITAVGASDDRIAGDFPSPRVVSGSLTPREIPAAPISPLSVNRLRAVPRLGILVVAMGCAGMLGYHVVTPAPATKYEDAVATGAASVRCKYGIRNADMPDTVTYYSCPHGGEVECRATLGCAVWTVEHDRSLRDWGLILSGKTVEVNDLFRAISPARRAVAEMEPRP